LGDNKTKSARKHLGIKETRWSGADTKGKNETGLTTVKTTAEIESGRERPKKVALGETERGNTCGPGGIRVSAKGKTELEAKTKKGNGGKGGLSCERADGKGGAKQAQARNGWRNGGFGHVFKELKKAGRKLSE